MIRSERSVCRIDPAPLQLVEKCSLHKVHSQFSLLGQLSVVSCQLSVVSCYDDLDLVSRSEKRLRDDPRPTGGSGGPDGAEEGNRGF